MNDIAEAKFIQETRQAVVDLVCMTPDEQWEAVLFSLDLAAKMNDETAANGEHKQKVLITASGLMDFLRAARRQYLAAETVTRQARDQRRHDNG